MPDRQREQLWRRCRRLAETAALPEPFDSERFVAGIAAERGRPIELMPVNTPSGGPCGLLMSTERADYLLYPTNTTALHRRHILLHEVGHLLCGHLGSDAGADGAAIDSAIGRRLMPSLPAELVRRVLGRTTYTAVEEQEAELVASLIAQRVARGSGSRPAVEADESSGFAGGMARMDNLFGGKPRRHHP